MSRTKTKPREIKHYTYESVSNQIFSVSIPPHWRKGQFVFNRASVLFGDDFVRSVGYDPFYKDENIKPFINALAEALNKSN
jgi:hypothetical protein